MTTPLEKTLKRELKIKGHVYIVAIAPDGLKLTLKGHRKGLELRWDSLVSGEAAIAVALHASVGQFSPQPDTPKELSVRAAPKQRRRGKLR